MNSIPDQTELTMHQAADALNVSYPYLMGLLERGAIPYRDAGAGPLVLFNDLMAYKQGEDAKRWNALSELTQQAQKLGFGY